MVLTFVVFAILSVISLAIYLVESISHQRTLRRNHDDNGNFYAGKLQPIMVTAIRKGEMQETYYYMPEQQLQHGHYQLKVERSLFRSLVMSTQLSAN
ncbi:hypothetical protein OKW21_006435 [Catalinimonas alkaloidigena]|uniref:hypothetical protein n=1 Tax=Catalinimonas alkaloidigena TaxID=1075417 RepID=UPI0024075DB0|nr:hypothetical protein [Catalinimonas alkaloidigena]MDF9801172.1 hypothetical protein [Catalinimonas alkaloidigena]